jgi:hypothetical protein
MCENKSRSLLTNNIIPSLKVGAMYILEPSGD